MRVIIGTIALAIAAVGCSSSADLSTSASSTALTQKFDITTLKGKAASLRATAPSEIRFSARMEFAADDDDGETSPDALLAPGSDLFAVPNPALLDGNAILGAPDVVVVNQDHGGAPQNETSVAVDPNNPNRIVAGANDYVTGTWDCFLAPGFPCSAIADGYSGSYFSNDGGKTWGCASSDPAHLGTLIPGVEHLTGGQDDADADPPRTFDTRGRVYYAGLGFNRASPPNAVAVNRGTFDAAGHLTYGPPTFVAQTTAPPHVDDKDWVAAEKSPTRPFRGRVYLQL